MPYHPLRALSPQPLPPPTPHPPSTSSPFLPTFYGPTLSTLFRVPRHRHLRSFLPFLYPFVLPSPFSVTVASYFHPVLPLPTIRRSRDVRPVTRPPSRNHPPPPPSRPTMREYRAGLKENAIIRRTSTNELIVGASRYRHTASTLFDVAPSNEIITRQRGGCQRVQSPAQVAHCARTTTSDDETRG